MSGIEFNRYDFSTDKAVLNRLIKEYKTHGNICVAFDYDNTLFDFHNTKSHHIDVCLALMAKAEKAGLDLVVWTCSNEDRYSAIRQYLGIKGITNFLINDTKSQYNIVPDSPKLFFSLLLDDRAGLPSAMKVLNEFLDRIKQ